MEQTPEHQLREGVKRAYSGAALAPALKHPFPVGRNFAASLGYPEALLATVPEECAGAFAGVSNVSVFAEIATGHSVIDVGCGSGLDSWVASEKAGAQGRILGVDFSEAMLERARRAAASAVHGNLSFEQGDAESLPCPDGSFDVALANGIFNLNPGRERIFAAIHRALRPGGAVFAAEIVLKEPLPEAERARVSNWFAWIAGAREAVDFQQEFHRAGFRQVTILRSMRNARTKNDKVYAVELKAVK